MEEVETSKQAAKDAEGGQRVASPIFNHKLRGPGESFADAMRQGGAAMDEKTKAMIADTLKKTNKS